MNKSIAVLALLMSEPLTAAALLPPPSYPHAPSIVATTSTAIKSPQLSHTQPTSNTCLYAKERPRGLKSVFSSKDGKGKKDETEQYDSDTEDEGFFRGLVRRISKRGDGNNNDDGDAPVLLRRENPRTDMVEGVFETMDELRRRMTSIRSTEFLKETVQSGIKLSPKEEERRLNDLREALSGNRQKRTQLELAARELGKEARKCRDDDTRKEALLKAKQLVELKIERAKEQKELYEKQRLLVQVASGKAPKSILNDIFSTPPKRESSSTTTDEQSSMLKNVQSVPQSLLSRFSSKFPFSSSDDSNIDYKEKSTSANNALASAQRFMANVFNNGDTSKGGEEWVVALAKSRIDPGEVVPIQVAGLDLLVVAPKDGKQQLYCIANSCSHLGTPLEAGRLEQRPTSGLTTNAEGETVLCTEECIVCPLHQTAFSLETGDVNGEWCPYPPLLGQMMGAVKAKNSVAVFDTRIRGKNIEIRINSKLKDTDITEDDLMLT